MHLGLNTHTSVCPRKPASSSSCCGWAQACKPRAAIRLHTEVRADTPAWRSGRLPAQSQPSVSSESL